MLFVLAAGDYPLNGIEHHDRPAGRRRHSSFGHGHGRTAISFFGTKIGVLRSSLFSLSTLYHHFQDERVHDFKFLTQGTLDRKNQDQKGQFGGSDHCPRPILTWKCLEALTGKMLIRVSISMLSAALNTIELWSRKAQGPFYDFSTKVTWPLARASLSHRYGFL
jgi:hypothetical protein